MTKRLSIIAFAAPALLLSGCAGTENRGLESVHQPVVSRTDFVFDVNTVRGALADGEADRLAGWLASLKIGYGDHVAVDDPNGSGARRDVAALVAGYGMFLAEQAPISGAPVAPGTLRVIVSRSVAKVPGCPDYSLNSQQDFNSNTSSNHGCSINSNVASMVADANDLVRGQLGALTSDPAISSKAINTLRTAAPTGAGGLKSAGTAGSGGGN